MDYKKVLVGIVLLLSFTFGNSQNFSIPKKKKTENKLVKRLTLPASIMLWSALISGSDFEKDLQRDLRNQVGNDYYNNIDDYTRYVPFVQMYGADIFGVKAKNHWFDQTKNLAIAVVVNDFVTTRLKRLIKKRRPNGSDDYESFPSGHTSLPFTGAGLLYQEFKDTSPLLAYSGFGFAITTGTFRMVNNAHWLSDVMMSAGIGILITELIYYFDPIIKWNPFKNSKDRISLIPRIENGNYGVYFAMKF
ncbi:phosphatase PAP2 family protein [Aquimarina latercula]|uniref:phosphatase PAP2 family protein n=1 Tax=Aquimarina latercula TaxID=987 RepID=UPI000403600A|nr:phosphatase PAP2 family protein [Aquimarina latercula]